MFSYIFHAYITHNCEIQGLLTGFLLYVCQCIMGYISQVGKGRPTVTMHKLSAKFTYIFPSYTSKFTHQTDVCLALCTYFNFPQVQRPIEILVCGGNGQENLKIKIICVLRD